MNFLNTEIDNLTFAEALEKIDLMITMKQGGYVVTPNLDHVVRLEYDAEFQLAYKNADLVLADGQPLIWISKILKKPIKEKISGSDLFPRVCELAAEREYSMFFLGAGEGVAVQAAHNLKKKYPKLKVAGTYSPEYGFEKDQNKVEEIWNMIHAVKPDILITCLGTPKQEIFLWKNKKQLREIIAFGFGAAFDFEANRVKRAPKWMQKNGLEWLYRLCQEPKRLFGRYFKDAVKIIPIIWKYRKV